MEKDKHNEHRLTTCIGHDLYYIRGLGAFSASSHGIRPCFFKLRTESAIMRAVLR